MIDLHSHTDRSDGTFTPVEIVEHAVHLGLDALAITDHDNFAGFDEARPHAERLGLELICGIELSTRLEIPWRGRKSSVHILGYFLQGPTAEFRNWLGEIQFSRHERNVLLADRLKHLGVDVTLAEAQALGRTMTGRPHFGRLLVMKGYVKTMQEAFDIYLGDQGRASVDRAEPAVAEGVRRIREAGGIPTLAHPVRLPFGTDYQTLDDFAANLADSGLLAMEVQHSEQSAEQTIVYQHIAEKHGLKFTGGSDFHGANKPGIELGSGRERQLAIPYEYLEGLKALETVRL